MDFLRRIARALARPGLPAMEELGVKEMRSLEDLDSALAASQSEPMFLFKHSTVCPISAAARDAVGEFLRGAGAAAPAFRLVKVIESRPVSNAIAERLGVQHQSPQLILVKAGQAVWSASHGAIQPSAIEQALAAAMR
ncbi:MAG: hypothetical protein BWZ10_01129 [candidate division BRC1 bacterium ADurb.BinA364]|nr:MAG: hypothetical protein BWZ10_01129 [candidate division BRC1 bacterium ADurb.BinA364]